MAFCAGAARKLSIPLVIFGIVGWIIYVIGFALVNLGQDGPLRDSEPPSASPPNGVEHSASPDYFPYWGFVIAAPIMFILTFVHLFIGRWFTGIFAHFLTAFVLVCLGGVVYWDGRMLFSSFSAEAVTNPADQLYFLVEWIGAMLSTLALSIFVSVWPLFSDNSKNDAYD